MIINEGRGVQPEGNLLQLQSAGIPPSRRPGHSRPYVDLGHWNKVFTDPAYYQDYTSEPSLRDAAQQAPYPDAYLKRETNIAYLAAVSGKSAQEMADLYDTRRDEMARQVLGKPGISDEGLFDYFTKEFERLNERQAKADEIFQSVLQEGVKQSFDGKAVDYMASLSKKLDEAKDMFSDEERVALRQNIDGVMMQIAAVQDAVAPEAKWIFDMMARQTGREDATIDQTTAEFYMDAAIERFAEVERPEREKVYDLVRAFAHVTGQDKKFFQQLGESLSRGISDVTERVPRNWKENDLRLARTLLANGEPLYVAEEKDGKADYYMAPVSPSAMTDMAELGNIAIERTMRMAVGPSRAATAEEKQEFLKQIDRRLKMLDVERELRNLAQTGVDPIKVRSTGWWQSILEEGMYAAARSAPYTAIAGLPFGMGLLGVGNALYAQNYDQLRLDYPDLAPEKAAALAAFSAPIEAVLERFKYLTLVGKLPFTGRMLRRLNHPGRGPFTRILFNFGMVNVEQNFQEILQESTLPFFQTMAAALDKDMPDYNWQQRLQGMPRELAVQFVALFPLTLIGGGSITWREMHRGDEYIKDRQRLLEAGFEQPAIDRIVSALTPDEAQQALKEESAKLTDEDKARGYQRIIDRVMGEQEQEPNVAGPRIVKSSAEPNQYDVLDTDGNRIGENLTAIEALELHHGLRIKQEMALEETQQRLIQFYLDRAQARQEAGLDTDEEFSIELVTKEVMDRYANMTAEEWEQRVRQWEIEHGQSAEGLNFSFTGFNIVTELKENMFRNVVLLTKAQTPDQVLRVVEEVAEGSLKMMWNRNSMTREQTFNYLRQYELSSGESLALPENFGDMPADQQDRALIEAFSTLAVAYYTGQVDKGTIPEMIASFIRLMGEWLAATLARAAQLQEGLDSGQIDADFEAVLATAVGLDADSRMTSQVDRKRQAVAAGAAIDPDQPLPAVPGTAAITVNVAPVRTDRLDKMTKGEVMKRAKSPKFIHLQQVVSEVSAAYGVPISARYPVIGGWTENGQPSLEVPESIIFETDDIALASEMAALIAITAPELQNAAFVWQYAPDGPHAEFRFQAKNAEAAYELAKQLEDAGVQGFSYDPKTREFSVVAMGDTDTFQTRLYEFVEEQSKQGRIGSRGRVKKALGESRFPGESEYKAAIAAARVRAGAATGQQADGLRAIADRAQRRLDRAEQAKQVAVKAAQVKAGLPVPLMSAGRITAELKGRQFDNIRAFGLWLDERFRKRFKISTFGIGSKQGLENASNALLYDVLDGLANDGSGMGWYDERVQETLRELTALHPEFNDDPQAMAVYIGILAATSQGYTVMQNFMQADRVYADYKRTGKIPKGYKFAQSSPAINGNLQLIQQLIDQYGLDGYTEFMDSEVTGRAIRDQYGLKAAGVTLAQITRGNAVMGQKIGSFFNNLRGRFDTITMDLWYTRTMHRYLGETLVPLDTPKLQTAIKKLRSELKKPGVRDYGVDVEKAMTNDEYAVQAGMRIMQKWGAGKNQYSEKGYFKFPDGYAVEKAARRINALGGMKGAPQNKSHRNYFADIVRSAKAKLDAMGIVLTEADIQAIIWYREKNLFAAVGRANIAAKPADYLDAAMGLKSARGVEATFAISPAGFYSPLAIAIDQKIQGKSATPEQVKAIIQNPQNQIKADEIKWSGIMQAIDRIAAENNGKVPKDKLMDYMISESVAGFTETVYRDRWDPNQGGVMEQLQNGKWQVRFPGLQNRLFSDYVEASAELERLRNQFAVKVDETRYSQYTLPGGDNYREIILELNNEYAQLSSRKKRILLEQLAIIHSEESVDAMGQRTDEARNRIQELDDEAYRLAARMDVIRDAAGQRTFTTSHFPKAENYIAHMRVNERTDSNGDFGLFIEELQSDRHQKGRKYGYMGESKTDMPPGYVLRDIGESMKAKGYDREPGTAGFRYFYGSGGMSAVYQTRQEAIDSAWKSYNYTGEKAPIPDAPFRKDWPLALFKRALRDAVAEDLTWIGWTSGSTQNARYDLSKHINRVQYDGTRLFMHRSDRSEAPIARDVAPEQIEDYVGKEIADRLLKSPKIDGRYHELTGVDLQIGGEGMKGFYDNILVKEIGKYVKQWGGVVEKGSVDIDGVYNEDGDFIEGEWGTERVIIWQIQITPEMKAGVEAGQPTYAISPEPASAQEYYQRLESAMAALDNNPAFRRERVATVLARFKAIKRQFEKLRSDMVMAAEEAEFTAPQLEEERASALVDLDAERDEAIMEAKRGNAEKFAARAEGMAEDDPRIKKLEREAAREGRRVEQLVAARYAERRKALQADYKRRIAEANRVSKSKRVAVTESSVPLVESIADLEAIISLLPPEAREKMGSIRRLAEFTTPGGIDRKTGKPYGRLAYLLDRIAAADTMLEEYLRKEFVADIEKLIERALPRAGDNRVQKGTTGVLGTKLAILADRIIGMTNDEVAQRQAEVEAAMTALQAKDKDQLADLLEEWNLLNVLGDLYKRSAVELDVARNYLRQTFGAGRSAWRIMEEARREQVQAMAEELASKLKEATPQTLKGQDPGESYLKQFLEWGNGFLLSHWSFQQLLRTYLPQTSFTIDWADRARRADIQATRYSTEAALRLLDAIGQAIGSRKGRDIGRAYYQMRRVQKMAVRAIAGREVTMERISIDLAVKILQGEASAKEARLTGADLDAIAKAVAAVPLFNEKVDSRGEPYLLENRTRYVEWERVVKKGTKEMVDMSPAEAIQFLLSWGQEGVRERMERQGWTEDSIRDMQRLIEQTPGALAAYDFLRKEYREGGAAADPVYQRMFGMSMPRIENYAPTRYMHRDDAMDASPFGPMPTATGMTPGPLKTRTEHNARMRQMDAFSVYTEHVVQMGHWIAFAELNREIRGVLKNSKVREGMEATFGRLTVQIFDRWLDTLATRGSIQAAELAVDNKFLNMLVAGKSISSLGGNLRTVFMQTDAGARALFEMPLSEVAKAMANPAALLADMPTAWNSETVQRRIIQGTSPEIRFIFESARVKPGTMMTLASWAMLPMVYTDTVLTSTVAAMVYRYHYKQAVAAGSPGAEAERIALEAMDRAVYNFAQPIDITSRSLREVSGNKMIRIFMMFMSDMRLKTALMSEALYGLAKGPKENRGRYVQTVGTLFFLAVINQTMGNLFRDWFSDEPDEDIWTWEGYAMAMMLAPFSGLFVVGAAADVGLKRLLGESTFSGSTNPLVGATEKATTAVFNMDKLGSEDPEEVMRQLDRMAKSIAVFGPKSAAPAAVINALKPIEGAYRNATSPETKPPKKSNWR